MLALSICLLNASRPVIKRNGNQFLLVVKYIALKQQISKYYSQIQRTEASFYIYEMRVAEANVTASVCALNLRIKF